LLSHAQSSASDDGGIVMGHEPSNIPGLMS